MWNKLCSKINQILFDQKLGSKQWDSLLLSILNTAQIQRVLSLIKTRIINMLCFGLSILSSTYDTTNNVQSSSELRASCITCLHHVGKYHPHVDSNPTP